MMKQIYLSHEINSASDLFAIVNEWNNLSMLLSFDPEQASLEWVDKTEIALMYDLKDDNRPTSAKKRGK